jgi:DNA invertase Pin-like site-specific DNA recombinase
MRERELRHFLLLDREQQESAIRRLAAAGMPEYTIATATGLSVEQVRRVIGERTTDLLARVGA